MAQASLDLIEAMRRIVEDAQPITGRGVGYKLFTRGLIPSMSTLDMKKVYRLLKEAREKRIIPWSGIVDEGRERKRDQFTMLARAFFDIMADASAKEREATLKLAQDTARSDQTRMG